MKKRILYSCEVCGLEMEDHPAYTLVEHLLDEESYYCSQCGFNQFFKEHNFKEIIKTIEKAQNTAEWDYIDDVKDMLQQGTSSE